MTSQLQDLQTMIASTLCDAFAAVDAAVAIDDITVGKASNRKFGHFQSNTVLAMAKKLGKNPRELATAVVEHINATTDLFSTEAAGPGFINITLADKALAQYANQMAKHVSLPAPAQSKTVVIDYSGPNLAKEMHVGHLRSTIIGDALAKAFTAAGHQVIPQNHVGDWGTQFGMLVAYLRRQNTDDVQGQALSDIEAFYRAAKALYDEDEEFALEARATVVALQSGDESVLNYWQQFTTASLAHCAEVYDRLGVSLTEADVRGESAYNDLLETTVDKIMASGVGRESEGAIVALGEEGDSKLNTALIRKSDGGFLYASSDLAAVSYRGATLNADHLIYVVDARQALHFKQVFEIARRVGFIDEHVETSHVAFGTMLGKDGKPFKTRDGGTVKLLDLLVEAEERAREQLVERNPDMSADDAQAIARSVGISAVKYADLSRNRTSDYKFDMDEMLALQGNTAPYLQYALVRVNRIVAGVDENALSDEVRDLEASEADLAFELSRYADVVQLMLKDCEPHLLCEYLYNLCRLFSSFYEQCQVIKDGAVISDLRVNLCFAFKKVLESGFDILGIQTVEKM